MHCVSTNVYSSTIIYTPVVYYYTYNLHLGTHPLPTITYCSHLLPICFLLSASHPLLGFT